MAKQRGRPPAGPKGQARATMRQISARLPDETCAQLKALSAILDILPISYMVRVETTDQSVLENVSQAVSNWDALAPLGVDSTLPVAES